MSKGFRDEITWCILDTLWFKLFAVCLVDGWVRRACREGASLRCSRSHHTLKWTSMNTHITADKQETINLTNKSTKR